MAIEYEGKVADEELFAEKKMKKIPLIPKHSLPTPNYTDASMLFDITLLVCGLSAVYVNSVYYIRIRVFSDRINFGAVKLGPCISKYILINTSELHYVLCF